MTEAQPHPHAATLQASGIELHPEKPLPFVQVDVDERGRPVPVGEAVKIQQGETTAEASLPKVSELLTGDAPAPDFDDEAAQEYQLLFAAIEGSVADYCTTTGRRERDRELQRVYRRLKDRPDGKDSNPLFAHLQAALRLFLTLRPLSVAEYEAVLERLITGVRRLAQGKDSVNYLTRIVKTLEELEAKEAAAAEAAASEGASEDDPAEAESASA